MDLHNDGAYNIMSTTVARKDPRSLTTLAEILPCLATYQSAEAELSNSLSRLLSVREPIITSLTRLQSVIPHVNELQPEARLLSKEVSATAETAVRVGGRVHLLDEEMRRVREAGNRVGQVMELKSSLILLQISIERQDWEAATRHCSRAMSLPLDVISGPFSEASVPTSESHLLPAQTLQSAREHLLAVFQRNFEEASCSRDAAATSRFFKLFPIIGWEAEGLKAYALFVIELVRVRTPVSAKTSSSLHYISSLTALFETIAMIIDQHTPVVEKYYGSGKMNSVIGHLLQECDRVVASLVASWEEERSMKRKSHDIVSSPPIPMFSLISRKQPSSAMLDSEGVDPRDIDKVVSEIAGMAGRWNLFRKFLSGNIKKDVSVGGVNGDVQKATFLSSYAAHEKTGTSIESTTSYSVFQGILTTYYIPLEVWYIRTIIDKAHRLSKEDYSQSPITTTTPDDVFYILKIVLTRLLSTGSVTTVEAMFEVLREVLDQDYCGVFKMKFDDVYRVSGNSHPNIRGEIAERDNRLAFIIILNDLDVSCSHLERLTREILVQSVIRQNFLDTEQLSAKNAVLSLSGSVTKIRSTLRGGVEQLFNQLVRPKLRNFIPDIYKDTSYSLDDEEYAAAEYRDLVRKRFTKTWDNVIGGYKTTFTEGNYRLLYGLALSVLLRPWEKFLMSSKFNELGTIRFDRDLRSIMTHLSLQTFLGDVRESFVRLQQISMLLSLDKEEDIDEFYNGSGITWKLSPQEAHTIASLRI